MMCILSLAGSDRDAKTLDAIGLTRVCSHHQSFHMMIMEKNGLRETQIDGKGNRSPAVFDQPKLCLDLEGKSMQPKVELITIMIQISGLNGNEVSGISCTFVFG